jgi:hypothetical protein
LCALGYLAAGIWRKWLSTDVLTLRIGEGRSEEVSSLYCSFRRQLKERDESVLETALALIRMPSDAFANRCEMAFEPEDDLERTVFEDCSAYYAVLSEIYHKACVICEYFEIDEEPGSVEYTFVREALRETCGRVLSRPDIPEGLADFLADELEKYSRQFDVIESLLITPSVIPEPMAPFRSIHGLMGYYLTAADTVLCLVYFRDPQCLMRSGYLDEEARRVEGIEFILTEMRQRLFANTRRMLEVSC